MSLIVQRIQERDHSKQKKEKNQWHDLWSPHSVPNGPTSVSPKECSSPIHNELPSFALQYIVDCCKKNREGAQRLLQICEVMKEWYVNILMLLRVHTRLASTES